VTFLDVGQGDATLLEVPEGAVLVDQGPPEAGVDERLETRGLRRLVALVLTHPQRDHVGGAAPTLRELDVGAMLVSGQVSGNPDELEALAVARERGVRVIAARAGQVYTIGSLRLSVLWPERRAPSAADPNEYAVVILASYGDIDVLLTADAESPVTGRLELPEVELLKVAHHGSSDDGLPALLHRLDPSVAVISVGDRNDYGHPAPSTLAALAGVPGLRVYRTDRQGTIVAESADGHTLTVRAEG
jgi:competence protein ComEC